MKRNVDAYREDTFDILVLGGGITGAGIALDAALRGLRVALIDKGDFASGTSSMSSKLIHGGLRYLEHGEFHLVYEALHERGHLLHNASHLVRPLRFLIPFYRGSRVPAWKWRAGLTLYDLLAGSGNLKRHRPVGLRSLLRDNPGLFSDGLSGGAEYFDSQMDDARLCLEVVQTAEAQGACVANYVEMIAFEKRQGQVIGVRAVDRIKGNELTILARQVVNATGPGVDAVRGLAGETTGPTLSPTKGVHLVMPGKGTRAAFLLLHPVDGRVFFVLPWMGKTLVGTTDTLWEGKETLVVTPEEIRYLLEAYNHYFTSSLQEKDLLGSFAGLRPLLRGQTDEPSALSREFRVLLSPSGLLSVAGGKFTTYRRMAEMVTDEVARRLGCRRSSRTRDFPLYGTPRGPWPRFEQTMSSFLKNRHHLPEASALHLVNRYGLKASEVAAFLEKRPELAEEVTPGEPDLRVEFVYQREHEMAITPTDFLLRRTHLGLFQPNLLGSVPSFEIKINA